MKKAIGTPKGPEFR